MPPVVNVPELDHVLLQISISYSKITVMEISNLLEAEEITADKERKVIKK